MRIPTLFLSFFLAISACLTPALYAGETNAWTNQFEATFTASCEVAGFHFAYPAQFVLSHTTRGVFLETDAISGQISTGSAVWRTREAAAERLLKKQGEKSIHEFTANGHTVYASTSQHGSQHCRTYIVVPKAPAKDTVYIQFRWQDHNPVDYTPMLDRIVASMK